MKVKSILLNLHKSNGKKIALAPWRHIFTDEHSLIPCERPAQPHWKRRKPKSDHDESVCKKRSCCKDKILVEHEKTEQVKEGKWTNFVSAGSMNFLIRFTNKTIVLSKHTALFSNTKAEAQTSICTESTEMSPSTEPCPNSTWTWLVSTVLRLILFK